MPEPAIELLRAIEAAAVRGWPAPHTETIEGWLCRHASGGSVRANSVAALAFSGRDIEAAIDRAEAFYAAHGAVCTFSLSDVSVPAELDARLAQRGYVRGDDHVTMAKAVDPTASLPHDVAVGVQPTNGWMEAYLSGLTPNRREVAPVMIARLARLGAVFVSCDVDGRAIASGATVVDGVLASIQCMATLSAARGRGAAARVVAGLEAIAAQNGCRHLYLQTGADNHIARRLYERCGFALVGRYHTRTQR
jgi:GNAT superfamily N-acetyltransferase